MEFTTWSRLRSISVVNSSNQQKCLDLNYDILEQFEFCDIRELSKYYTAYEITWYELSIYFHPSLLCHGEIPIFILICISYVSYTCIIITNVRIIIILVFIIFRCVGICNQINMYLWLISISDKFVLFNIILMNRII